MRCESSHESTGGSIMTNSRATSLSPGQSLEDEWLWGWDATTGIVAMWADRDGTAWVWRRESGAGALLRERERFRPWLLLASLEDVAHLGSRLVPEGGPNPYPFPAREGAAGEGERRMAEA